jgi:hypothetical protein
MSDKPTEEPDVEAIVRSELARVRTKIFALENQMIGIEKTIAILRNAEREEDELIRRARG